MEADYVFFGTGFRNEVPYLPQEYQHLVIEGGIQLYRHVVHPLIPNIGFIGYNHSFLHIAGIELACIWLLAVIRGDIKLPSEEAQLKDIERVWKWKIENMAPHSTTCVVNTRFHHHFEELLNDLGVSTQRKPFFLDYWRPYFPEDYKDVVYEVFEKKRK